MTDDIDGGTAIVLAVTEYIASLSEIMSRVDEARKLRYHWNTRWKPGGEVKLSAAEQAAIIARLGELQRQFATDEVTLTLMLGSMVASKDVTDLVGMLAPGYPAKSPDYYSTLYAALALGDVLEDYGTTGRSNQRVLVSVEMVAETVSRYFVRGTGTPYMPTPDAFRDACLASHGRVGALRDKVRALMVEPIPALPQIEHKRSTAQIEHNRPVPTAVGLESRDALRQRSMVPIPTQWPFDDDDA
jgi:hypothetical protein